MRELDQLSPDQRAVLSLVLMQDKSFQEVASLLGMSEQAVRERAHGALDALASASGPTGSGTPPNGNAHAAAERSRPATKPGGGGGPASSRPGGGPASSRPGGGPASARLGGARPGSKLGGALLLGAIVAAVVVGAVAIPGGGGKGQSQTTPSASRGTGAAASSRSKSAGGSGPKTDKVLALSPVEPSLKAAAVAYVFSDKGKRAFYVAAQGLPTPSTGTFYAVWLYNSPSSAAPLGRAPAPNSSDRTEGGGPLPANAGQYHKLVVTRETSTHTSHPGEIVLSGAFALH